MKTITKIFGIVMILVLALGFLPQGSARAELYAGSSWTTGSGAWGGGGGMILPDTFDLTKGDLTVYVMNVDMKESRDLNWNCSPYTYPPAAPIDTKTVFQAGITNKTALGSGINPRTSAWQNLTMAGWYSADYYLGQQWYADATNQFAGPNLGWNTPFQGPSPNGGWHCTADKAYDTFDMKTVYHDLGAGNGFRATAYQRVHKTTDQWANIANKWYLFYDAPKYQDVPEAAMDKKAVRPFVFVGNMEFGGGGGKISWGDVIAVQNPVQVVKLDPSWDAAGGGGVFSAYVGPAAYDYVSPGLVGLYDGREAGIIKAGLAPDPDDGHYWDEGLFGFKPYMSIEDLLAGPFNFDVETQAGVNPVWMTIEIDIGVEDVRSDNVTYQFVPTSNPAGWHTVDGTTGLWQKWNNNQGDTTGNPYISLADVAALYPNRMVVRAYLRLGMGDSYNNGGTGTIAWVDKAVIGEVTYDFAVTDWYVSTTGNDADLGTSEATAFRHIQHAIDVATAGDRIHVAAGTYSEHVGPNVDLSVTKSLSLMGAGKGSTFFNFSGTQHGLEIRPDATGDVLVQGITFGGSVTGNGIIVGEASPGGHFNNLVFDDIEVSNSAANNLLVLSAVSVDKLVITESNFHHAGSWGVWLQNPINELTIDGSIFNYNGTVDVSHGIGFDTTGGVAKATVTNSQFNYNKSKGINITGLSNAVFDNIEASYNSGHDGQGHGFSLWEFTSGSNNILVKNSLFTGNAREGIMLGAQDGKKVTGLTFESNQIINNQEGGMILWENTTPAADFVNLVLHHNRIVGNPNYDLGSNQSLSVDARDNWFGCNTSACIQKWGIFDTSSWLVMKVSAVPALAPGVPSTFTADLTINNADVDTSGAGYLPASTVVGFTPTDYMNPDSNPLTLGKAASTFTPPVAAASFNVCANLDAQTVCLPYSNPNPVAVYVDIDWVGTTPGESVAPVYPAGAPAATFGFNAFGNLHDALLAVSAGSASAPSYVYVDAGTYSGTGSILINKNWVSVKLNTGVVIQNASPCFTVAADYVTIQAASLAGAKCVPTGHDTDGILVTGARKNLTLEKFEIDGIIGTGNNNGVHFDGVMTDLVMVDLFIHHMMGNGVLFAAQPAGILDIHGNMFRDNMKLAIDAGTFVVPAEYNSWGDYDGPAGSGVGNGISSGVDADPWTHVDMNLVSSGSPISNTVVTGNTITYAVRAHMQNVTSMDFTLNYPSNLSFVSYATPGNFSSETITQTSGSVHFVAYQYGAGISGSNYLFEATFTAGAVGTNLPMDLDAAIDGFGMATAGSSTNIYAYELVDSTVTILEALDLTALSLIESVDLSTWTDVFGTLPAGYVMGIDPANAYEYLDVDSLTVNHPLATGLHPFYMNPAGLPTSFFDYWAAKGVVSGATGWQGVMWQIINGTQPMFYLKVSTGPSYDLIDGLQYLIGSGEQPLRLNGTYPLGTYNFSGTVTDIYGGTDTVPASITLIEPLVLQSLDLLDSVSPPTWTDVYGTLALGFTKVIDPLNEYEYLDAANLVANRTLADGLYPYYLDISSLPAGFYDFWAAKGVTASAAPGSWEAIMWQIITGAKPMFYLKVSDSGTTFDLIDGLQYQMGAGEQPLRINGTYPLGTYNFTGTVADEFGVVGDVAVSLTLIPPLDLSDLDLLESVDLSTWTDVFGTLPTGYIMAIDPANTYEYLDAANVVVNRNLANGSYPFFLDKTTVPASFFADWAAKGVVAGATGWQGTMWEIINGNQPMFYLKVSGTSYDLIDGLTKLMGGGDTPLKVNGDYTTGTYHFTGIVADLFGYTDGVAVDITFVGTYTIKGTFSMQGRSFRGDVPVTLTKVDAPLFGPYSGMTFNAIFENLVITGVQGGTYMVTTLQPRYLNVIAVNNKTPLVDRNRTLSPLELKGGNAIWRIPDGLGGWTYNNVVNVDDASRVGTDYGVGNITNDGDVNFDNRVNIQDLALVGGNFYLTSEVAYGIGNVSPWIP